MKKQFLLILILLSLPLTSAFAASVIMEGNYVRTAISDNGTLGYGSSTSPGLLHDPDGTGTFGIDDYLTPGTPWEMFSVSSEETGLLTNNNTSTSTGDISGSIEPGATTSSVTWSGTYDVYFTITHEYTLATDSERIDIVTTITALSNLTDLEFARAIDPDPDVRTYGSYYTVNGRGYDANSDGDFDDHGFFLVLSGVTSGDGHLFYANKSVPFDAYLKIGVNTTTYYIGLLAQQAAAT